MLRIKALRRNLKSVVVTGLISACLLASAAVSAAESDYSFERWQVGKPDQFSLPVSVQPTFSSKQAKPGQNFSTLSAEFAAGGEATFLLPDTNLDALDIVPQGQSLGMIDSDTLLEGPALGFVSGIDMGTVALYSSGALLGVVGSNIGRDGKDDAGGGSGDPTSFIYDPAIFVTDEFEAQYGLGSINAQYAYARGHTGEGVLVSVMDTRFNVDHANLSGVFVEGYNVVDENTVVDEDCTEAANPCRHGTHVAGIIAGNKNDTSGSMHGVAYGARIKPVPFLEFGITTGNQQTAAFSNASGVDSGTGLQIVAMNNSWGAVPVTHSSTYNSKYFKVPNQDAIAVNDAIYMGSAAAADDDTILVFAAGNDGWNAETGVVRLYDTETSDVVTGTALATEIAADASANISSANRIDTQTAMPTYAPDNTSYVVDDAENEYMWIVVVATDDNDTIATFSNACGVAKNYCIAAPGEDIFATNGVNSPAYVELDGTSMATPHVTGAIAILADMYPNLLENPENITQILLETATDLGDEGVDDIYGHGLLNLQDATGPLGDITITDSSFGANSLTYGDNAEIHTPIAFGDALSTSGVRVGGVDKFDRVFMLDLPVVAAQNMHDSAVNSRADESLTSEQTAPVIVLGSGVSFAPDHIDSNGSISGAAVAFTQADENQHLGLRFATGMKTEAPVVSAEASRGYDHYFEAMAHATGTRERMSFDIGKTRPDGTRLSTSVRLDRDGNQQMTLISRSGYETYIGGAQLAFSLGGMTEEGRLLGGKMTGALGLSSTHTLLARSQLILPLAMGGTLTGYYEYARSMPSFTHDTLVSSDAITSDSYGVSWQHQPGPGEKFAVILYRPVAVTGGRLNINTVTGYTADGDYRGETLGYGLSPSARETSLLGEYRRDIFKGGVLAFGIHHQHNASNIEGRENTGGFIRGEMQF